MARTVGRRGKIKRGERMRKNKKGSREEINRLTDELADLECSIDLSEDEDELSSFLMRKAEIIDELKELEGGKK